jgi:hypothetical protein
VEENKMSRVYTVPYQGTLTNAGGDCDLIEILPADDKPIKLLGFIIGQTSEVADAAEEGLRLSIIRLPATVTSGSGGSAVTPAPMDSADAAAGAACEANNTTVATTNGTAVVLEELAWNIRSSPLEMWWPDPAIRFKAKQGEALVIRLQTTVADDISAMWTAFIEEE